MQREQDAEMRDHSSTYGRSHASHSHMQPDEDDYDDAEDDEDYEDDDYDEEEEDENVSYGQGGLVLTITDGIGHHDRRAADGGRSADVPDLCCTHVRATGAPGL